MRRDISGQVLRPHRLVRPIGMLAVVLLVAAACSSPAASTPSAPASASVPRSSEPPAASAPTPAASPVESPVDSLQPAAGTTITEDAHGLAITLPSEWIGVAQSDVGDTAKIDALKAEFGAPRVEALVSALQQHPEYWFAAMRIPDEAVVTSQIREFDDFATWASEQEAALKTAYGEVTTAEVTVPSDGVSFTWTADPFAQSLYGFERPGGATLFTFGARPEFTEGLDSILETFTDAGT